MSQRIYAIRKVGPAVFETEYFKNAAAAAKKHGIDNNTLYQLIRYGRPIKKTGWRFDYSIDAEIGEIE